MLKNLHQAIKTDINLGSEFIKHCKNLPLVPPQLTTKLKIRFLGVIWEENLINYLPHLQLA